MARSEKFSFTSGGAAYPLEVGFEPDTIEVWNYTQWAVDAKVAKSYWHRGMTSAYSLNELCEDTSTNHTTSSSNGFTVASTSSITSNRQTISAITAANPGVVTVASTSGWTTGDGVRFRDIGGMVELNDNLYKVVVIDSTTLSLKDSNGDAVDTTAFTTFATGTSLNYLFNISKTVDNTGTYRVTLGTDIVGANSDLIFVECKQSDNFTNLGDIG